MVNLVTQIPYSFVKRFKLKKLTNFWEDFCRKCLKTNFANILQYCLNLSHVNLLVCYLYRDLRLEKLGPL